MRRLVFLFVTILTGYMAGVFRSASLTVLDGMDAVLFAAAFFQAGYLKNHLSAEAQRHGEAVEKSRWLVCRIKMRNTGRLPVSRFRMKIRYGYGREADSVQEKIREAGFGREKVREASPVSRQDTKYIDGSCTRGESTVQFEVSGTYCGIMTLHMVQLRVYDYLSLFSGTRKMEETVEVAVFPQEKALRLELPSFGAGAGDLYQQQVSGRSGDAGGEVRQLREYQSGDSSRWIHWNQTAKTGQLWVKEYERETDSCVMLLLDTAGESGESEADAYYELVSALVLGLLEQTASVHVSWHGGGEGMAAMEVGNREQCRELLLCLYRRSLPDPAGVYETTREPDILRHGGILKLDIHLRLYRDDILLYTFTAENLEEQIAEGRYIL